MRGGDVVGVARRGKLRERCTVIVSIDEGWAKYGDGRGSSTGRKDTEILRRRLRMTFLWLDLDFDGYGETAAVAEGFLRDFEDGGGLLTLVFAALDEGEDAANELEVDGAAGADAG